MADPNDPNQQLLPGIGSDVGMPLTGWTTNMPSFTPGGAIGGDWRFPSQIADPRLLPAPAPAPAMRHPMRVSTGSLANAPMPPVRPANLGAQTQAPPAQAQAPLSFWDALRNLFAGSQQAQVPGGAQGMTGMLQAGGQRPRGTDSLGNPFNRFG
jgi:hypothetical protein